MNLHIQKSRGVEGVGFRLVIPEGVGITSYGDYPLRVGGKEGRRDVYTYK
jgi:hypothetical protein